MTAFPGSIATPARSPLFVDGIAVDQAVPASLKTQQAPDDQRFWSSEPRHYGDQSNELMIVTLSSARLINYITLDLPHFPSQYSLAYRDANGNWQWIAGPNGIVLQFIIAGSVPSQVNSAAALTAGLNPYHYGAGHWIHYDEPIKPVTAGALLVAGTRALQTVINVSPGQLPHDASGWACPYPLGVRNLDFGMRVLAKADVPYTPRSPDCPTERVPFGGADDVLGNPVQLTMRENRASDLLAGLPWKCAPQPLSSAVVNLYADARDSGGNAQVIDRFYVDPTTSGVSLNLYYTTAAPDAAFQAVDTPLGSGVIVVNGSSPPVPDAEGLSFPSVSGYLDVDCKATGADFTKPWWMGWECQPQFDRNDGGSYMICDAGHVQLWYSNGNWNFTLAGGGILASWPAKHSVNERVQFAVGWDGANLHCWSQQSPPAFTMTPCSGLPVTKKIRFGGSQQPGWGALNGNPYFAGGSSTGWAGWQGTFTVTGNPPAGAPYQYAGQFTVGTAGAGAAMEENAAGFPAAALQKYLVTAWVWTSTGTATIGFDWQDSSHNYLSSNTVPITVPANTWTQISTAQTSPASTAFAYPRIAPVDSVGNIIYAQAVIVVPGAAPAWPGNHRLTSFICKQEKPDIDPDRGGCPRQFTEWGRNPRDYTCPPEGPGPTTENACCRFDVSQVITGTTDLSPWGFNGGLGTAWASAIWTPVALSFKLTAGFVQFPPVAAVAFKFEFTDLAPEPYEFYTETTQTCTVFPVSGAPPPAPQPPPASPLTSSQSASQSRANIPGWGAFFASPADTGLAVSQQIAPLNFFSDTPPPRTPPSQRASLPTEALYATDAHAAQTMAKQGGSLYNFQKWQGSPQAAPKQVVTGPQSYQTVSIANASRIGYFVGLSQLTMYRVDYTATSDTAEYIDTFGDTAGLDPASLANTTIGTTIPWTWTPNLLSVPVNLPPGSAAIVNSPVFYSMHQVTGVQFASVQAAPFQLLPDPEFSDPALPFVAGVGDVLPLSLSVTASSPLGAMVMVSRAPGQIWWAQMMASYALWSNFTAPALSWLQLEGNPSTIPYGGIAYTGAPVAVSGSGVLHIAARVFADKALTAPLYIQLLDGDSGAVVAEEPVNVIGGAVTEWSASYVLGQPQAPSTLTWGQVAAANSPWSASAGQSWSGIDTFQPPLGSTLSWQLVQYGLTDDVWGVDDVSIFEDSIVWEFSNDGGLTWWPAYGINANPSGALVFPPPAPGKGYQFQWRVKGYRPNLTLSSLAIRPWYSCYPRGVPPRIPGLPHGPNVSHLDHYGPIAQDPYWQAWSNPVPQWWFFTYQQLLQQNTTYTQPEPAPLPAGAQLLGQGLVVPLAEILLGPETFSDIYSAIYTYTYGIPDGGDVYTDSFGNDEYQSDIGPTP